MARQSQPRGTEPLTSSANARNLELEGSHLSVDVDEGSEERGLRCGEGSAPAVSAEEMWRQCWLAASSVSSAAKCLTCAAKDNLR